MNPTPIRVVTASRLHFGLLSLPGAVDTAGNLAPRHFGGVGLKIDKPGVSLSISPASDWSSRGPCSARALAIAQQVSSSLGIRDSFAIEIDHCSSEHVGLGTGTQLSLAIARAITLATEHNELSTLDLARLAGRGQRSAIGIHGFEQGGFLVEAGKRNPQGISPLVARAVFPHDWAILLVIPHDLTGDHGQRELEAFETLAGQQPDIERTDRMCRLVLLGILPALMEHDLLGFGESLYEFNRQAGEMYRAVQGGIYSHPHVAEIVELLRSNGILGAGQSSWGPAVFGITDFEKAKWANDLLTRRFSANTHEVIITSAANRGASIDSPLPSGERGQG